MGGAKVELLDEFEALRWPTTAPLYNDVVEASAAISMCASRISFVWMSTVIRRWRRRHGIAFSGFKGTANQGVEMNDRTAKLKLHSEKVYMIMNWVGVDSEFMKSSMRRRLQCA